MLRLRCFRPFALVSGLALLAPACTQKVTGPAADAVVRRTVTAVLADSLGYRISGESVTATSLTDSAGLATVVFATTDGDGAAVFTLRNGPWALSAVSSDAPPLAAAGIAIIPGSTRPAADTIAVHLTLHTASAVSGRRLLAGRSDHSGTMISVVETGSFTLTTSDGSFLLANLPPGHWTLTSYHLGFAFGVTAFQVTTPASSVVIADETLLSDSGP